MTEARLEGIRKMKIKHCRESQVLLPKRQEMSAYFTVVFIFFHVNHDKVLCRSPLPQWKED